MISRLGRWQGKRRHVRDRPGISMAGTDYRKRIRYFLGLIICGLSLQVAAGARAAGATASAGAAAALRARHAQLSQALEHNQFQRPLALESNDSPGQLKGDIYAVIDFPYASVNTALNNPAHWCDIVILHLNTKYCHATTAGLLQMAIGKKFDQPLEDAYRLDFSYRPALSSSEYFAVELAADKGPLGTSDYRIVLEALALSETKTFLHLTYAYSYNFVASVAMQGYLATAGSAKIGFSKTAASNYIGGTRGIVERNTMRYYLAIEAYLNSLSSAPAEQPEKRLQSWFSATERYAPQLHEIDQNTYMKMKRAEYARQQTAQ